MESVQMSKFEIADMPGMNTLAFLVEESQSELAKMEIYYSLQQIDHIDREANGKVIKEFSVFPNREEQNVVLVTLTSSKAILSTAVLSERGLNAAEDKLPLSYGSLYNDNSIQYKEFVYTPNMKRHFAIIDTSTSEEVRPVLYIDELTNEVKGKCKLLPLRPYVILEVKGNYNRGAVVATDGRRIKSLSHGELAFPDKSIDVQSNEEIEIEGNSGDELIV